MLKLFVAKLCYTGYKNAKELSEMSSIIRAIVRIIMLHLGYGLGRDFILFSRRLDARLWL